MNNVIIYTNDNGGVSICIPTGEIPIKDVQAKDIPADIESFIVNSSMLPEADSDFFDAWEQTNGIVTVNLEKSREITRARLRAERAPLLAALDVEFQRALENGADVSAIVAEKVRLRDITSLVEGCGSTAELRALNCRS